MVIWGLQNIGLENNLTGGYVLELGIPNGEESDCGTGNDLDGEHEDCETKGPVNKSTGVPRYRLTSVGPRTIDDPWLSSLFRVDHGGHCLNSLWPKWNESSFTLKNLSRPLNEYEFIWYLIKTCIHENQTHPHTYLCIHYYQLAS